MADAKRALEEAVDCGSAFLRLPAVEDLWALVRDFVAVGFVAAVHLHPESYAVAALRRHLGLDTEEFARCYGFDATQVRAWEGAGRCRT